MRRELPLPVRRREACADSAGESSSPKGMKTEVSRRRRENSFGHFRPRSGRLVGSLGQIQRVHEGQTHGYIGAIYTILVYTAYTESIYTYIVALNSICTVCKANFVLNRKSTSAENPSSFNPFAGCHSCLAFSDLQYIKPRHSSSFRQKN